MNVFLINGSPKRENSNTYQLSKAFLAGLQPEAVRECCVQTKNIHSCLGCFACWNKTPGQCCLSDDMAQVIEDMLWADVIIWSFPLYYFTVPGPLKNLMDRQLPMVLPFMSADSESGGHPSRYDMSGKRHVVISTCGFYTTEGNYDGVNALFDHICGKGKYTTIYCAQGELFRVKELHNRTEEYLSAVTAAGREYAGGGISPETRQKLSQLLFPRETFEAMADASWGIEKSGDTSDESLVFTRQMAALYNKAAYSKKDKILEMVYTDIGKRYQIILGKDGSTVLTENFQTPTTIIETPYSLWLAIAAGEEQGEAALMQQKYRVKGDFNLMIQWDQYFGSQEAAAPPVTHKEKPTNMSLLLLPWMALWISASCTDPFTAALISLGVCTLLPLVFFKNRILIFDRISSGAVAICSILLMLQVELMLVLPLSYLGFGVLWTVCGFLKVPLTAYYSVNTYGDSMISNPLFIKTNRILTLCWGILYLLLTVVTFALSGYEWIVTASSLLPSAMGIFTIWFQRWYPAHVARGK